MSVHGNSLTSSRQSPSSDAQELEEIRLEQRRAFAAQPMPGAAERRAWLTALERLLIENDASICRAISEDFGHRPETETRLIELFPSLEGLRHARGRLNRWMAREHRRVSMWFKPGRAEVRYQPLGCIGIIAPWNYPLFLTIGPLVAALAAGNRVMLKPSELTPRFGELLAKLIADRFPRSLIHVVLGGVETARAFASLPFDHLLFTGSTQVGREVMASAARHLTPVTLELGGKSPAIIAPGFDIATAARRIVFGKLVNAGQTCVAPDYVLAPADKIEELLGRMQAAARAMYKSADSADYASIANDRHFARLQAMLDDARAQGARVEPLLSEAESETQRRFTPVAVLDATPSMRVLREEIFGPILPVLAYRTLDEAIDYVNAHDRPLALYLFEHDRKRRDDLLARTASGGVTVNDTLLHVGQEDLPFGGVGPSGMGRYHGLEGFRAFSQVRSVFSQGWIAPTALMYPPYGRRLVQRLLKFMLGK